MFEFQITARNNRARAGVFTTPHGNLLTPVFAPVGTQATVKTLTPEHLKDINASLVLSNTYHLYLRPGDELVRDMGGLHKFMGWHRPMLTDSGGFQVFSLAQTRRIDDDGVTFKSHIDGSTHRFTPEKAIAIQENLGADIIMAFDECVRQPATPEQTRAAVDRTIRWARRCRDAHRREGQMLFGICQGGTDPSERDRCAAPLLDLDFPGYAIGGLSVGEDRAAMLATLDHTAALLPRGKPRYFMGLGKPDDLLDAIRRGIDMFDCVIGTRNGRHGTVFTSEGALHIRNKRFERDGGPLDPACGCPACRGFSRAYLSHLFKAEEMLGPILASLHNTWHLVGLVRDARQRILDGTFR